MSLYEQGILDLRDAILIQAIKDYERALRCWDTHLYGDEVEAFFLSDWGQWLSGGKGEILIRACKRKVYGRDVDQMEVIKVTVLCPNETAEDMAESIKACAEEMDAQVNDIRREKA